MLKNQIEAIMVNTLAIFNLEDTPQARKKFLVEYQEMMASVEDEDEELNLILSAVVITISAMLFEMEWGLQLSWN